MPNGKLKLELEMVQPNDKREEEYAKFRSFAERMKNQKARQLQTAINAINTSGAPINACCLKSILALETGAAVLALKHHPGHKAVAAAESLHTALEMFFLSYREFIDASNAYIKSIEGNPKKTIGHMTAISATQMLAKGIYSVSVFSKIVYYHAQRLSKHFKPKDYDNKLISTGIASDLQNFIFQLRNIIEHEFLILPEHTTFLNAGGVRITLNISKDTIISCDINKQARTYLDNTDTDVNISATYTKYAHQVTEFYSWLFNELDNSADSAIIDYKHVHGLILAQSFRQQMNLLINIATSNKIDPYKHLDKHLTDEQIAFILSLPKHSKHQIDTIIELIDTEGYCDAQLRNAAYKLFGAEGY